ncbi:MAG: shikimate kinase [Euryarchaeota archaeon]|nr:shikimate kinase [Euryarchaeota archaeon]
MRGHGTSHGAATIVSALATGKGAAFGIDLTTTADVILEEGSGIDVIIEGITEESPSLAMECARTVLNKYASGKEYHVSIVTRSDIPASRGLKSSSAAANAIIEAMLNALDVEYNDMDAVRLGAKAAIRAGVSITGAFDDACASKFGGIFLTDNTTNTVISRDIMSDLSIFIHVPEYQIRKSTLPKERMVAIGDMIDIAFQLAKKGDYLRALTLNGLCYSTALSLDTEIVIKAYQAGAIAAGLTGSGPATIMLVEHTQADDFQRQMKEYSLMKTSVNNGRSKI